MKTIPFLFIVLLLVGCSYRVPSKELFSESCGIEIPEGCQIVQDKYEDMGQDWTIYYNLKMNRADCAKLVQSIRSSVFFNPKKSTSMVLDSTLYVHAKGIFGRWYVTKNGYYFRNIDDQNWISVEVDTLKMTANFTQAHD
jgi:hypothetical protein